MSDRNVVESVELPADFVARVEARVRYTEFADVEGYLTHVLAELLYEVETDTNLGEVAEVDEQQVQERLNSLGYLNE